MEDNEELAPFLDGTKPMNISLICKAIEVFNLLLSEFLEDADTFTNRIGGDKKSKWAQRKDDKKWRNLRQKVFEEMVFKVQ